MTGSGARPVSGQLCGTTAEEPIRVPVSCCLSATGLSFLGHPAPAEGFSVPRGWLTDRHRSALGPRRGCHVPHERDTTGLGALSTPGRRCSRGAASVPPAPPHSQRPVLHPAAASHRRGSKLRGIIEGSLAFARPAFPLPVTPGWNRSPWASTLGFAPRSCPRRTPGRERALSTGPELHLRPLSNLLRCVHSTRATSCRTMRSSTRAWRRCRSSRSAS